MFEQLAQATTIARKMPSLSHQTPENRQAWRKVNDAMNALSERSKRLRALWKATLQAPTPDEKESSTARLTAEMFNMISVLAKARQQLRVALP
jgi:hypothetical protein